MWRLSPRRAWQSGKPPPAFFAAALVADSARRGRSDCRTIVTAPPQGEAAARSRAAVRGAAAASPRPGPTTRDGAWPGGGSARIPARLRLAGDRSAPWEPLAANTWPEAALVPRIKRWRKAGGWALSPWRAAGRPSEVPQRSFSRVVSSS